MSVGIRQDWLDGLFTAIDAKDTSSFLEYLTDDALFRFGSAPAARGKGEISAALDGFFSSIKGLTHSLGNVLENESTIVCEGEVAYQRMDDSEVTLPFTNVFEVNGALVSHYKIYIDIAPLYAG
jgi:ketosteroid isomerase-like protein